MKIKKWNKSLWTGLVFGAVSIAYLAGSYFIPPSAKRFGIYGASFMPRLYGIVMLLCAVVQLVTGIRQYRKDRKTEDEPVDSNVKRSRLLSSRNVALGFLVIFLYVFFMKSLGFCISSTIMLICLSNLMLPSTVDRKKAQPIIILIAIVLPILAYLFFKKVVFMALPGGPFLNDII